MYRLLYALMIAGLLASGAWHWCTSCLRGHGDSGVLKSEGYAKQIARCNAIDDIWRQCYAGGGNEIGMAYDDEFECVKSPDGGYRCTITVYAECYHVDK